MDTTRLTGVHPSVVKCVIAADAAHPGLFIVSEGVRSKADQLRDWLRHVTRLNGIAVGRIENGIHGTGFGPHEIKDDGFGHAVDLAPLIGGVAWGPLGTSEGQKWEGCYEIAEAMRVAAIDLGVRLRWGGQWDVALPNLPAGADGLKIAHESYVASFIKLHGRSPLQDGPHFELV